MDLRGENISNLWILRQRFGFLVSGRELGIRIFRRVGEDILRLESVGIVR